MWVSVGGRLLLSPLRHGVQCAEGGQRDQVVSSNGDDAWVLVVPCRPAVVGARSRMAARPDVNELTASVVRILGLAATSLPSYAVSSTPRTPTLARRKLIARSQARWRMVGTGCCRWRC